MASIQSFNPNPITHLSPRNRILHTPSDLQRLLLRRTHPTCVEFRLEEADSIPKASFKKLMTSISKKTLSLKNPPIKNALKSGSLTRHLRELQITPADAGKEISKVTYRFSKLTRFAILDNRDSFVPMRIKKKAHPIRFLKSFVYDHEFCRDFMRCARYVSELKIRKTSLDLSELRRFMRLESFHVILRTKYLSLPEEDMKFTQDLGGVLLRLPLMKNVVLEQEIDPEIQPYMFLGIKDVLKDKARVNLVADFLDVSNQRNKNLSVEKIMQKISDLGVENLKVNYAGVVKVMKRFGRLFHAPLHMREDIYMRFLNTITDVPFKRVYFLPSVHSDHINPELKGKLVEFLKPDSRFKIPGLNLNYHLDVIEFDNIDLLEDLYNEKMPIYEITITSTTGPRKHLPEKLKEHFSKVFQRIEAAESEFSVQLVAKNLSVLKSLIQIISLKMNPGLLKGFNVQLIDPIDRESLQGIFELLRDFDILGSIRQLGIDFAQKEAPNADNLFSFLSTVAQSSPKMNKLLLSYRNQRECEYVLRQTFEGLRNQHYKVDFDYEINDESTFIE